MAADPSISLSFSGATVQVTWATLGAGQHTANVQVTAGPLTAPVAVTLDIVAPTMVVEPLPTVNVNLGTLGELRSARIRNDASNSLAVLSLTVTVPTVAWARLKHPVTLDDTTSVTYSIQPGDSDLVILSADGDKVVTRTVCPLASARLDVLRPRVFWPV